jgi:hypothetical protein
MQGPLLCCPVAPFNLGAAGLFVLLGIRRTRERRLVDEAVTADGVGVEVVVDGVGPVVSFSTCNPSPESDKP